MRKRVLLCPIHCAVCTADDKGDFVGPGSRWWNRSGGHVPGWQCPPLWCRYQRIPEAALGSRSIGKCAEKNIIIISPKSAFPTHMKLSVRFLPVPSAESVLLFYQSPDGCNSQTHWNNDQYRCDQQVYVVEEMWIVHALVPAECILRYRHITRKYTEIAELWIGIYRYNSILISYLSSMSI